MPLCDHLIERRDCADCQQAASQRRARPAQDPDYGPWFQAQFPGYCDGCGEPIEPGDQIRADGRGGWICEDCGSD